MTRPGRVVVSAADIARRLPQMASEIAAFHADAGVATDWALVLVCVLKGSLMVTADLARALAVVGVAVEIEPIAVRSYLSGTHTTGTVELVKDIGIPLRDRDVLIVEDVVDTGLTTAFVIDHLRSHQPRTLRLATLLDKPGRRLCDVPIDVTGFIIGDDFVVGYGLDAGERWRELPDVHLLEDA